MLIAIFNQAGGVGKTTLTRDLGYELHLRGRKVLLIDADPQGTLGSFFGEHPHELPATELFWTAICDGGEQKKPAIRQSRFGPFLGLSNRKLIADELSLMQQKDVGRLNEFTAELRNGFDYVLVDCPPKISEVTLQILYAVDTLLLPVQTEAKSVINFAEVQMEIGTMQRRRKNLGFPLLEVMGVVPTLFNQSRSLHKHHLEEIRSSICSAFGYSVLPVMRDYIAVAEAGTYAQPLKVYAPKCPVVADIEAIADAIVAKEAMNG